MSTPASSGPSKAASTPRSTPPTCASGCSGSPPVRITWARPTGKENAEFMAGLFRSWGYDTQIEEFQVLFPTPKTRLLEMVAPTRFKASLSEPALPEDATSGQTAEQLPALQRLLDRRRRHRRRSSTSTTACPRTTRSSQRRGIDVKGKIVHRPLRRLLARHQAQGGGRARRHRLPHLLRSPRRRLLPGRRLSQGRLAQRARRPARLGGRHAALSRAIR